VNCEFRADRVQTADISHRLGRARRAVRLREGMQGRGRCITLHKFCVNMLEADGTGCREKEEVVEQYVFVRLHAREGEESAVEKAVREVAGPSREEAGCLSFHVFRSMRDRRLFYIHSRWVDEAAFQKHAELAHTVEFLKRVDALLDQARDVARTEMID
jgi:quinol monooxygenase YgiN